MPRSVTFKFKGLKELEMALHDLPEEVGTKVLWNAAMHGAEVVRLAVQREVSARGLVEHGKLLENILKKKAKTDNNKQAAYRIGAHSKKAFYDLFLELGTRKMSAKPFLLPAAEQSRPEALDKVAAVLKRRIALAVKKSARMAKRSYL